MLQNNHAFHLYTQIIDGKTFYNSHAHIKILFLEKVTKWMNLEIRLGVLQKKLSGDGAVSVSIPKKGAVLSIYG